MLGDYVPQQHEAHGLHIQIPYFCQFNECLHFAVNKIKPVHTVHAYLNLISPEKEFQMLLCNTISS